MFGWRRYVPFRVYFNTDTACAQQRLGSNKAETSLYLPGYGWLNVCAHRSGPENEDKDGNIWITIGFNPTRRAGDQEKYDAGEIERMHRRVEELKRQLSRRPIVGPGRVVGTQIVPLRAAPRFPWEGSPP